MRRQEGDAVAGDRCRQRAEALQQAGRLLDALREFHQAKINWFHGDTLLLVWHPDAGRLPAHGAHRYPDPHVRKGTGQGRRGGLHLPNEAPERVIISDREVAVLPRRSSLSR